MQKKTKQIHPSLEAVSWDELTKNGSDRLNEDNWKKQITLAKPLVCTHLHGQVEIALHAMHACEVLEHRRKKYKTEFTPKKFALSVGLEPATLYEWIAVTRNVVMRLPEKTYNPELYSVAYRAHRKLTFEDTPEKVAEVFEEEKNKGPYAYYVEQLIKSNRTGYRFLRNRAKNLPPQELAHLRIYTRHITILLDELLGAPDTIEPAPEKEPTNRTTDAFTYTRKKSYDGDDLTKRKGRDSLAEYSKEKQ
jgi:hypothetical protein